jgi:hypothetical protein
MDIQQNILLSGIFMAITIVVGIWLGQSGKPYNNFILTIHKLIALVNIVFAVFLFINIYKTATVGSFLILLTISAGLSILALLATGAIMSIKKASTTLLRVIHILATILVSASAIVILYLMV